jgi:hypothetical protein
VEYLVYWHASDLPKAVLKRRRLSVASPDKLFERGTNQPRFSQIAQSAISRDPL